MGQALASKKNENNPMAFERSRQKKKRMESKNISYRAFESVAYNFHFKKLLKNDYNLSRGCYVAIYGKISVIL